MKAGLSSDLRHELLEEASPAANGAAVHVVDLVGDDHLEVGGAGSKPASLVMLAQRAGLPLIEV
jgi:hypothetical protein